jgi:hypothetical protein
MNAVRSSIFHRALDRAVAMVVGNRRVGRLASAARAAL